MSDVVAVALGAAQVCAVRVRLSGEIAARDQVATCSARGIQSVARRTAELVERVRGANTLAIGLGLPGALCRETGVLKGPAVNIPDSRGFPLGPHLAEATGLPIFLEHEANLVALGETWKGAGQGQSTALVLTFGAGIGGGLVLDGELYRGGADSPEFGHLCIEVFGRRCGCGNLGCFEAYASAAALGRAARDALKDSGEEGDTSMLWLHCGGDLEKIDVKVICDAAREGDPFAGRLLDEGSIYVAAGLGSLINALNPTCVVVAGELASAGEVFFSRVRALLAENRALAAAWASCKLLPAALGDDAVLMGAARIAFRKRGLEDQHQGEHARHG